MAPWSKVSSSSASARCSSSLRASTDESFAALVPSLIVTSATRLTRRASRSTFCRGEGRRDALTMRALEREDNKKYARPTLKWSSIWRYTRREICQSSHAPTALTVAVRGVPYTSASSPNDAPASSAPTTSSLPCVVTEISTAPASIT